MLPDDRRTAWEDAAARAEFRRKVLTRQTELDSTDGM
jgi:hypothetical protein